MAEDYTEILLNWDKDANVGDIKVSRIEEVSIAEGKLNTHEQSSIFPQTTYDELVAGLEGLQRNKATLNEKLGTADEKSTKIRKDIVAIDGVSNLTEELIELQRKIENIGMIKELDKIKAQTAELKDNITDLDKKILARNALLNNIREV